MFDEGLKERRRAKIVHAAVVADLVRALADADGGSQMKDETYAPKGATQGCRVAYVSNDQFGFRVEIRGASPFPPCTCAVRLSSTRTDYPA